MRELARDFETTPRIRPSDVNSDGQVNAVVAIG